MVYEFWSSIFNSVLWAVGVLVVVGVLGSTVKNRLDTQKIYNENISWMSSLIRDLKQERESLHKAREKFQKRKKEWEIQLEKKVFPDMLVNGDLDDEIKAIGDKLKVIEGGYRNSHGERRRHD
jgi:hypothetical protein